MTNVLPFRFKKKTPMEEVRSFIGKPFKEEIACLLEGLIKKFDDDLEDLGAYEGFTTSDCEELKIAFLTAGGLLAYCKERLGK